MIKHLTPHIAIKNLKDQIKVYERLIDTTNLKNNKQWYKLGIESMEKRIKLYR